MELSIKGKEKEIISGKIKTCQFTAISTNQAICTNSNYCANANYYKF